MNKQTGETSGQGYFGEVPFPGFSEIDGSGFGDIPGHGFGDVQFPG